MYITSVRPFTPSSLLEYEEWVGFNVAKFTSYCVDRVEEVISSSQLRNSSHSAPGLAWAWKPLLLSTSSLWPCCFPEVAGEVGGFLFLLQ